MMATALALAQGVKAAWLGTGKLPCCRRIDRGGEDERMQPESSTAAAKQDQKFACLLAKSE